MINANIFGNYDFRDLPTIQVADVPASELMEAMNAFAAAESAFLSEMTNLLADEGDETTMSFGQADSGRFQPLNEVGTIEARRAGGKYQLGFPIYPWGDRFMYTQAFLDEANLSELNQNVLNVGLTDVTSKIVALNSALLLKTNFNFDDNRWPGKKTGTIAVKRLVNNDSADGYVYAKGNEIAIGTLNHYKTSGSNSIDNSAYQLARDTLQNVGVEDQVIFLVSGQTADDTKDNCNAFVERKDDTVVDPNAKYALVTSPRARGRIYKGEVWEWPHMPDGYIVAISKQRTKPLRIRVSHLQKYRGLQLVTPDGVGSIQGNPLVNKMWQNIYGVGVQNRTDSCVVQITNSGTYTDPTL